MKAQYWLDNESDMDRKRRRQAEFLIHRFFPWTMVSEIGVIDTNMAETTKRLIAASEHQPSIVVARQWYC